VNIYRFEKMLADLSARFVNIPADQVDSEIEAALKQLLEFFQVDRCGLLGISPDRKHVHVTHAAYADGIERVSGDIDLAALFPWCYEKLIIQGNPVCLARIEELPEKAVQDRANHIAMGVRSLLDIPLFFEGSVSSIIVINALRRHHAWPEIYIPRLRLLGEIFINALERRRAEQALRENEERLTLAVDSAEAGLWSMEVGTGLVSVTARTRDLFCFTPDEELTYESFLRVIHPEDREKVRRCVEQAVQAKDEVKVEYRIVLPDGSSRWISSRGRLHCASSGEAERLMGLSVDVSGRKQADSALLESMERYRAVVDAYDGLIYICSQDYRIEYMNGRMIERTGRNAIGEPCYRALHDRDSICPWCVNDQVFLGETVRWEVQSPKDHRWYYVVNTPIRHADGTLSKQSMMMDITERKQAEDILKESEAALKHSQKDLWKLAGRLISAQEEELRRLSRELHDDLTQRLAVLAIEAGKLELNLNDARQALPGPVQKISQIKEQLIKISEDVHRISRQLHPTILDDLGLVRAIESECAALMRRENIEIILRNEDVPVSISNDIALCLYRVVQEGLRNVLTHSRAKNCEILLKGEESTLCLAVSDNGVGFDPLEVRNKPGLGLSSMRERAHLVRGDFSIDTRPGKGTAIRVCVPLKGDGA
jgi:PAS domain S-box-containing protein